MAGFFLQNHIRVVLIIVDGLYWGFIRDNKDFFLSNPRLSMLTRTLEKMKNERKTKIFSEAETFLFTKTLSP
jgi:deoxyribodipyrimidine photolyase-like uncharacterized protein